MISFLISFPEFRSLGLISFSAICRWSFSVHSPSPLAARRSVNLHRRSSFYLVIPSRFSYVNRSYIVEYSYDSIYDLVILKLMDVTQKDVGFRDIHILVGSFSK